MLELSIDKTEHWGDLEEEDDEEQEEEEMEEKQLEPIFSLLIVSCSIVILPFFYLVI